jgi:hypothetical protein
VEVLIHGCPWIQFLGCVGVLVAAYAVVGVEIFHGGSYGSEANIPWHQYQNFDTIPNAVVGLIVLITSVSPPLLSTMLSAEKVPWLPCLCLAGLLMDVFGRRTFLISFCQRSTTEKLPLCSFSFRSLL